MDANYDGKITASDLAILDRDWGGTIHSIATDEEWESKSWTSINYWDNDVINNISDTEVDFKNSAYDHQSTVDSLQGDPLAGDIYSGLGDITSGSSLYNANKYTATSPEMVNALANQYGIDPSLITYTPQPG